MQPRDSLYIHVDRGLWILLSLLGEKNEKKRGNRGLGVMCGLLRRLRWGRRVDAEPPASPPSVLADDYRYDDDEQY